MAYKEKVCPKCGTKHTKRGEFCSRSCGNSRKQTSEQKEKIGAARSKWLTSGADEAEVQKHNFISKRNNAELEPVAPPTSPLLDDNQFVAGGDVWTSCDDW
jgi:hypothetical protein